MKCPLLMASAEGTQRESGAGTGAYWEGLGRFAPTAGAAALLIAVRAASKPQGPAPGGIRAPPGPGPPEGRRPSWRGPQALAARGRRPLLEDLELVRAFSPKCRAKANQTCAVPRASHANWPHGIR